MQKIGEIEESHSAWNSSIMLVPKADGVVWFCVDFWKLNAVSHFDTHPVLYIDKLLDRLYAAPVYLTLELDKGC